MWPPRVKSHRDAASFDLGGESGKKASIHFQCFDPRTFSIPSIYPALSIKDAPRNPRFSLLPLPLIWDKKVEEESRDAMEERHEKENPRRTWTKHRRRAVREGNYSGFDGLTLSSYSPATRLGGGLLEGNQADNPINKLVRIHTPRILLSLFSI